MWMLARDAAFYRRVRVDETDDAEMLRRVPPRRSRTKPRSGSPSGGSGRCRHFLSHF